MIELVVLDLMSSSAAIATISSAIICSTTENPNHHRAITTSDFLRMISDTASLR
jgi:hypothetical protein